MPQSTSQAPLPQVSSGNTPQADTSSDESEQDVFKPMTRDEAQQWRARQPEQSVWQVVWWQMILAVAVVCLTALVTRQASLVWSVAYGTLCILLPTALMVYGLSSRALSRWFRGSRPAGPAAAMAGVFFWEGIKILFAVALMGLAPVLVPDLNWLGLLAGLVVVLKSYWLVLWQRRAKPIR